MNGLMMTKNLKTSPTYSHLSLLSTDLAVLPERNTKPLKTILIGMALMLRIGLQYSQQWVLFGLLKSVNHSSGCLDVKMYTNRTATTSTQRGLSVTAKPMVLINTIKKVSSNCIQTIIPKKAKAW